MATRAGVGMSELHDAAKAADEAVSKAFAMAGADKADLVLLFATVGYPQEELVRAVRRLTPGATLAGCSGEGVITNRASVEAGYGVTVAVIASDEIRFSAAVAEGLKEDSGLVGYSLGETLRPSVAKDTFAMLTFPDGITINFDRFYEGLTRGLALSRFVPLYGGTSADAWELKESYQYCNDKVVHNGATLVLLSGKGEMVSMHTHGALPIGKERTITKADKNEILEIDAKPALSVLQEYLAFDEFSDWGKAVTNVALGFRATDEREAADGYYVRYVPQKNEARGSISICTEVAEGTPFWMMRRDHEKIGKGNDRAVLRLRDELRGRKPAIFFQFDCCGRGCILFQEAQKLDLIRKLQADLGEDVPWIGFHSYGEIGPVAGKNHFHNQTVVVAALC